MEKICGFSRLKRAEDSEGLSPAPCFDSHEVHVLAVDDSLLDRKVIEKLLKVTSCKVTAVDSGRRALQFLGLDDQENQVGIDGLNLKVDLIITDYCMPGMTGYELLKRIKGSSAFCEIPVVIMSSENVLARINRCLEEGAEDFIVKPVKLADVERLKSYMSGEHGIQRQDRGFHKRKLPESPDISPLTSPPPAAPSPPSLAFASPAPPPPPLTDNMPSSPLPPPSTSSSSAPPADDTLSSALLPQPINSPSSPRTFPSFASRQNTPCSPTSLDSPARRIKLSSHD